MGFGATDLAAALGIDHLMVHRVWRDAQLKPHLGRTFKVSNDPHFVEKLVDVVGLDLDPPERALVLCADERSQIQALDHTQPGLPMKRGAARAPSRTTIGATERRRSSPPWRWARDDSSRSA